MSRKDAFSDSSKPNLIAMQQFMLSGKPVRKGDIVAKSSFPAKQDWMNLLHMPKPRVEETAEKVGKSKTALPGAK